MSLHAGQSSGSSGGAGTPGGASGTIQYNSGGSFAGITNGTTDGTNVTLSGQLVDAVAATASFPAVLVNGTWYTGGSSTTTKPQVLVEPSGVPSAAWSTAGTGIGINATAGFIGRLLDCQVSGVLKAYIDQGGMVSQGLVQCGTQMLISTDEFRLTSAGLRLGTAAAVNFSSTTSANGTLDAFIRRQGAANIWLGAAAAAAPVAQTLTAQGSRGGTDANVGGGNFTIQAGQGTGTGTPSQLLLQTPLGTSAGSTAQTYVTGLSIVNGQPIVTPSSGLTAGGNVSASLQMGSTTAFGIYFGSGAPTIAAGTGSLYLRSDGTGTSSRMYVNAGASTWTAAATAA